MPIVGIGASAGGIEAFRSFFGRMPADSGMGFVVVLHLPPNRKSLLPELLGRWTEMQVIEVTDGCEIEANCVYVPPPGVGIILQDGHLSLHRRTMDEPREPSPISVFFDSLASSLRENAIGVILSGTGNDGALGLKAIKACGGLTLAQASDGTNPQHDGMPTSAIATGAVDIISTVEAMPGHIMAIKQAREAPGAPARLQPEQTMAARLAICGVLQKRLGHDFSGYKEATFLRRVERRMQVLRVAALDDYIARLDSDRGEALMLFKDLLIGVTAFFRNADTFAILKQTVLPRLFHGKAASDTIRVWVPGCATGEEAYSLAMLLREYADDIAEPVPRIQLFATDIDEPAIATARAGRYPSTLLEGLSADRLARFFVTGDDGTYFVSKEVRALCTFSAHSLTRDPPFSRMDLISCRNLLIYLDTDLQAAVIPAFHYSLAPGGILLLGSSETISRHENLFAPLDKTHRIFQRRDVPSPPLHLLRAVSQVPPPTASGGSPQLGSTRVALSRLSNRASARVLERFAPAFVVVTAEGEITQFSSRTGRFLEPASGTPSQNVLAMARRGLRGPLHTALEQAVQTDAPVERPRTPVEIAGEGVQRITLVIEPVREAGARTLYLVVFIEDAPRGDKPDGDHPQPDASADHHLEAELHETREQLRSITEEHETALEELRSANEELHSVNEELQSTNEELETSKEEIQSINEELQTVIGQLAAKVDELDHKNNDLQNLFESTQVATIFLNPYLVIRGFTPAVASIYNLIPSDEGRPLTDIVSQLRYDGLRDDLRQVLTTLKPLERRVERDDGLTHYLMRMLPYRTPDSTVDGAIITFVDVTSIVQAEQHQRLLVDELNHRVRNMLSVVISLATQTMRSAGTMTEFSASFLGRVHALAAAYALLSNESWQSVPLRDVLTEEFKPFLAANHRNIVMDGPRVALEPRAALALGMAIHELTTNAVKHGALSVPEGTLSVRWWVEPGENGGALALEWTERNGPPVVVPARGGFGRTLIERGLKQDMGAEVTLDFAPEGVNAMLRAPLNTGPVSQTASDTDS
jgi:two-component system CheB/CheR fusion protein